VECFTVLLVFLPESGGIRSIPGIPRNGILAVLPAKIVISVPAEFRRIPEWPQELPERNCIRNRPERNPRNFFNSNSNI
jgi:hypothetical protein